MYSLGATVSLGGYQTQRIDVGFPLSQVPEGWTYQHVRGWVDAWFRYEVGQVIQREQARGNYEVEFPLGDGAEGPASLPPAHSALPLPPGSPWAPAPQSGGVSPLRLLLIHRRRPGRNRPRSLRNAGVEISHATTR